MMNTIFNSKLHWKNHLEGHAKAAETYLWDTFKIAYSTCPICEANAKGMEMHLVGEKHYKAIGSKFNWKVPPPEVAEDLSRAWVEKIPTSKGLYFFNHLTGRHGFMDATSHGAEASHGGAPCTSAPAYSQSESAPAYSLPLSVPAYSQPVSHQLPLQPASPATAQVANPFKSKADWKKHLEPGPKAAEDFLWRSFNLAYTKCPVCEANAQSMEEHLVGEKHYRAIGAKFNWIYPPPEVADDPSKPWIERILTPQGPYFFNHLTGRHGFVDAPALAAPVAPAAPAAPAAPSAQPAAPTNMAQPQFNQAHWMWQRAATAASDQIEQLFDEGDPRPSCPVCAPAGCNQPISKDHILSLQHFNVLQQMCAAVFKDASQVETLHGVWVQELVYRGRTFHFNHVTAKEMW